LNTSILDTSDCQQTWYKLNGEKEQRKIYEMCLKRGKYDVFSNSCCPCISYSKCTCNTNVSVVMPGTVAQYCVNYTVKNTQKDDTSEYQLLNNSIEFFLSKASNNLSEYQVAIRRVLSATFAHQSNNIVGPAMASYFKVSFFS
jgi:hypothetical protein